MGSVYAVLVAFNPDLDELFSKVLLLSSVVNKVIVCNNSDFDIAFPFDGVEVINFRCNIGIAHAQSIGMESSFKKGADFVFQLDQDSVVPIDMVDMLLKSYYQLEDSGYNVGLIGPLDFDKFTGEINKARVNKGVSVFNGKYSFVDSTLSSGSLIPKKAYDKVGGMFDELFIDVVDHEYCWRLQASGFKVVRVNDARLPHRLGEGRKKLLGLISVGVPAPFRHYYAMRNTVYLFRKRYVPLRWKISSIPKIVFKLVLYPVFLDKGFMRFRYMIKGVWHGATGKLGKLQ